MTCKCIGEFATVLLHMPYEQAKIVIKHPDSENLKFQCLICSISEDNDLTCNCFFQLLCCNFNTLCCLNFLVFHIRILQIKKKSIKNVNSQLFNITKQNVQKINVSFSDQRVQVLLKFVLWDLLCQTLCF